MIVYPIFFLVLGLSITSNALTSVGSSDASVTFEHYDATILPSLSVCGNVKETNKIFGGKAVQLGELPWIVALEYKTASTGVVSGFNCAGSLINERYVLTTANCITNTIKIPENAVLGEWHFQTNPDCVNGKDCADPVVKIKVEKLIPHAEYDPKTGENDIGLIRLSQDVAFTEFISPICLPPKNLPFPSNGVPVTVAGWGKTETGQLSQILLKVDLPITSSEECGTKLKRTIAKDRFCAGGEEGKDACVGDSGSPAMRIYGDKVNEARWYQYGIVSSGSTKCGVLGFSGIYTRVDQFVDWIVTNIKTSSNL